MRGRSVVLGLGTALPPHRVTQVAAADLVARLVERRGGSPGFVRRVFRAAGVEARHTVLEEIARGESPFGASRPRGTGTEPT